MLNENESNVLKLLSRPYNILYIICTYLDILLHEGN